MSRNGTGIFAVINPILVGALRSSSAVNQNFTDMGTQITNTLPLSGVAAMTGQLKAAANPGGNPGISFKNGNRVGFRRIAPNVMSWVVNGSNVFHIDSNGKAWIDEDVDIAGNLIIDGDFTEGGRIGEIEALDDTGALVQGDDDALALASESQTIAFTISQRVALIAGVKADIRIPFDCTITGIALTADAIGDAVVDIWKDTLANFPPTVDDSITASAKPTLSNAFGYTDETLAGWTTAISAGDVLRFNLVSVSDLKRLSILLRIRRYA